MVKALQSLERESGLPLALDPAEAALCWPEGITVAETRVRTFAEMRDFVAEASSRPSRDPVYAVYRSVARREDAAAIREARLRYDITVIPPGRFLADRQEFFRTAGHYHARTAPRHPGYPEVYEVIAGRAYWLIQRPARPASGPQGDDPAALAEVYAVEAGPGEKAVMLPGFGHLTINAYDRPLVVANWISEAVGYDYEPYRRLRGGGYWALAGGIGETIEFAPNPSYRRLPELRKLRPAEVPALGLIRSRPSYALARELGALRFLSEPGAFTSHLSVDRCYRAVI